MYKPLQTVTYSSTHQPCCTQCRSIGGSRQANTPDPYGQWGLTSPKNPPKKVAFCGLGNPIVNRPFSPWRPILMCPFKGTPTQAGLNGFSHLSMVGEAPFLAMVTGALIEKRLRQRTQVYLHSPLANLVKPSH